MAQSYEEKRILITGASGYVASAIVQSLAEIRCTIVRLSRQALPPPPHGLATVRDAEGDVTDERMWATYVPRVDCIFHLAAQTSLRLAQKQPREDLTANVHPMLHLLQTCRRTSCRPFIVFAGTATEVGLPDRVPVDEAFHDRPVTVYDLHKLVAETYLRLSVEEGAACGVTLRLANVYGPGRDRSSPDRGVLDSMIRKALRGEALTLYGDGLAVRDYVFIDDVAGAFLYAGAHPSAVNGRHFVIGSGEGHTIRDAAQLVADRVNAKTLKDVRVAHIEPPEAASPIDARHFIADTTRFRQATGWSARITLAEGIDRTIDSYLRKAPP